MAVRLYDLGFRVQGAYMYVPDPYWQDTISVYTSVFQVFGELTQDACILREGTCEGKLRMLAFPPSSDETGRKERRRASSNNSAEIPSPV